jgi:purine nucleosidase
MTQALIFDTDPGIDDAMALLLILKSPELELLGVTTVFGNNGVGQTTHNALHILNVAGRADVPVIAGAGTPLARPYTPSADSVHGADGLGNLRLPPPATAPTPWNGDAAGFIIDTVLSRPGEVTLMAVGALTNLALAVQREPRVAQAVRRVIVMGGAVFTRGNITPVAEANIFHDPEAARAVFAADWPVVLVGLDVTMRSTLTEAGLAQMTAAGKPETDFIARIAPVYFAAYQRYGIEAIPLHDPSAVAYALDPTLFETRRVPLYVECEGRCAGQTVADLYDRWGPLPEVEVCTGVDAARLVSLFKHRLMA